MKSGPIAYFCAETFVPKAKMQWLKIENKKEVKLRKWPESLPDVPIRSKQMIFYEGWT